MAFDVSALSTWVENNSKEIALKAVSNAQTVKLLTENKRLLAGIKTKEAIRLMDVDVQIQDGSSCGRNPLGTTTLGEVFIEVKPMKDEQDFCSKSLRNTVFAEYIQKGQAPAEEINNDIAQSIMDYRAAKVSAEIEKIVWRSDSTLTGSTNFKYIDGYLTQLGTGNTLTLTGSTITAKFQHAFLQMNVDIRSQEDFVFFIGEDKMAEYTIALATANLYRPADDNRVFGTNIRLLPTAGLNGQNKLIAARISNMVVGIDGEGDQDKADFRYSVESQKYYMDFHWAIGVRWIRTSEVYQASI